MKGLSQDKLLSSFEISYKLLSKITNFYEVFWNSSESVISNVITLLRFGKTIEKKYRMHVADLLNIVTQNDYF